jgi:hypothetical protein
MLDANTPTFRQQYPNGAIVRDRLGRLLRGVLACDPVTGEVIKGTMTEGGRVETHEFHPAPLRVEPCQWLHIGFD